MSDPSAAALSDEQSNASQLVGGDAGNLFSVIDRSNVHGLNLTIPEDAKETIKPWNERETTNKYADSNVDDQLIIHVPFAQSVRVRSVLLKLGRGESTPQRLRLYANHANIVDFAEAENSLPAIDIALLEGEATVKEYPLRVSSFATVNSLSLFFSDSTGGDLTRIYYIGFKGEVRTIRKEGATKLEVPTSNAADASLVDKVAEKRAAAQTTAR